jgi:glucose/arabinose dehydrogenase
MNRGFCLVLSITAAGLALAAGCGGGDDSGAPESSDSGSNDASQNGSDAQTISDSSTIQDAFVDAAVRVSSCGLPGSVQFSGGTATTVPGGDAGSSNLSFLKLPDGFCFHDFANVGNPMHMQFAPGGELFVASPTTLDSFGGPNGTNSILILADDNHDGYAETPITFVSSIDSTYGIAFDSTSIYYQNATAIMKRPYASGDRTPTNPETQVANITGYTSSLHWSKPIVVATDGTIYVGNGGDQGEACVQPPPARGGIYSLASSSGTATATGLRWPVDVRCATNGTCFGVDEGKDFSETDDGRSRLFPIRSGDYWGFPCCSTVNHAFTGISPAPDCSGVATEPVSFAITDYPRGFDFEKSVWPAPYKNVIAVGMLGDTGTHQGARIVTIATDAGGNPSAADDTVDAGGSNMTTIASGWESVAIPGPSDVKFSADGRLFVANAQTGDIFWIDHM